MVFFDNFFGRWSFLAFHWQGWSFSSKIRACSSTLVHGKSQFAPHGRAAAALRRSLAVSRRQRHGMWWPRKNIGARRGSHVRVREKSELARGRRTEKKRDGSSRPRGARPAEHTGLGGDSSGWGVCGCRARIVCALNSLDRLPLLLVLPAGLSYLPRWPLACGQQLATIGITLASTSLLQNLHSCSFPLSSLDLTRPTPVAAVPRSS
jgi:hypothetical protein